MPNTLQFEELENGEEITKAILATMLKKGFAYMNERLDKLSKNITKIDILSLNKSLEEVHIKISEIGAEIKEV